MDTNHICRYGVYYLHPQGGIADSYVLFMLKQMKLHVDALTVLVHGDITKDSEKALKKIATQVRIADSELSRREVIALAMMEELSHYDEVFFLDDTVMGPVFPLSEMFSAMLDQPVDIWTVMNYDFLVVLRKEVICHDAFRQYWSQGVSGDGHDFVEYIKSKHFLYASYISAKELARHTDNPLMGIPRRMVEQYHCPFFLHKVFYHRYDLAITSTLGQAAYELYQYLRTQSTFDVNLIWDYVLRTQHQVDLFENLHLQYVLSTSMCAKQVNERETGRAKIALVMHLYFPDLLEDSRAFADAMVPEADVFLTTDTEAKKQLIEKVFASMQCNRLEVRVIENRGRDVSSILTGVKDVINDYSYVCFVHDKKTAQTKPASIGEGFARKLFGNMLPNRAFVTNVIETFERNPRLGMLVPPPPHHGAFYYTMTTDWGPNYDVTKALYDRLGYTVPMSPDKMPIAPLGTFFWFRPKAMAPLYQADWTYKDFPPEPNGIDGTLLHAIERLYGITVQQAGFYPAYLLSDTYARLEYASLRHYVRSFTCVPVSHGYFGYYVHLRDEVNRRMGLLPGMRAQVDKLYAQSSWNDIKVRIRMMLKKHLPKPIYRILLWIKRLIFGPRGVSLD